ncbi:hypothetical protein [Prescottella subtropica]|uniref:hypothetical protein n=1 Tax=Prescottella subtropica TaxID=2545757 RepID=UPI0010F5F02D|nr:hypothetical protein [Prescottella subtropica]
MLLRRTAPAVAVLGAAALVLTACGDSNDDTPAATETTTTTTTAPGNTLPVGGANLPELTQALAGDPCSTQLTDPVTALITYQYGKLGHPTSDITVTTKPGDGPGTMKGCTFTIAGAAADWTVPTITVATLAAESNPLSTTIDAGKIAAIEPAPAGLDIRSGCNESDVLMPKPCTQTRIAYDQAGLQIETMLAESGKTFKDTADIGRDRLDTGYRTVTPTDVTPQFQVSQTSLVGDDWTMRARIATRGFSDASAPIDAYTVQAIVTGSGDPAEDKTAAALTKDISSYLGKNTPKIERGASIR